MVVPQDEAIGHQIVGRIFEIKHLADGAIVGILHLLLPQAEPLRRRSAAEEGEGLGEHEAEIDREQGLELARRRERRIFPNAEYASKRAAIGIANLDCLTAEDHPLAIQRAAEVATNDRDAAMPPGHHHFRDFHSLGKFQTIVPVDRQSARRAAVHQLFKIASLVLQGFEEIGIDGVGLRASSGLALEELDQLVGAMDRGTQHQRHEEAVDEHPLLVHPREVRGIEVACEPRPEIAARILLDARTHEMRPDRQAIVVQVAQHTVELGVPVIEITHVGRLECTALQLEGQHDGAGIQRHHFVGDMACVRQELGRQHLFESHLHRHLVGQAVGLSHCDRTPCA